MKKETEDWLRSYLVELVVYAGLVAGYFFLVLRFFGSWVDHLFKTDRPVYAAVTLALIVLQGLALEALTRFLLAFIQPRTKD